ncbi:MAG: GLUG motif-containing protein [Sedimentisphaerales bacterium]
MWTFSRAKKQESAVLLFILLFVLCSLSSGKYSGGTGEPNDPYIIATPNDLCDIGNHIEDYNKNFIMVNDINMAGFYDTHPVFMISGNFIGVFDGNGHSISNIRGTEGLFETLGSEPGVLKNLALIDVNMTGDQPGGLVKANFGVISNCSVTGKVTGGYCVGGLAGWSIGVVEDSFANCIVNGDGTVGGLVGANKGDVSRCSTSGTVSGTSGVGGLTGDNHPDCTISDSNSTCSVSGGGFTGGLTGYNMGIILNCHTTGSIIDGAHETGGLVGMNSGLIQDCWSSGGLIQTYGSFNKYAGGLVGYNPAGGRIIASFSNNQVSGHSGIGGLVGGNDYSAVEDCYSFGSVDANENAGGLIGSVFDSSISRSYSCASVSQGQFTGMFIGYSMRNNVLNCFWDTAINPDMNGIGNISDPNLIGLPTAQLQMRSTFTDAGWDMINVWDIGENQTYPFLRKHLPGDINKDGETNFYDFAILAEHWLSQE